MSKQKYYAVRAGRETGIFTSWDQCKEQVMGFPGAVFKSFAAREEAQAWLLGEPAGAANPSLCPPDGAEGSFLEIYVDGSFRADTGEYSYGMVVLQEGEELCFQEKFSDPEAAAMRNVAGEIRGAMAAMEYALAQGAETLYLYYDYAGICHWCSGEWKANKPATQAYRAYFQGLSGRLQVCFMKVKGHSHNHYNDLADKLAKEALGIGLPETKDEQE